MVRYLILFLSIVLLGACATTSEPETKNITQTISSINETSAGSRPDASGFIDLADGARYQNVTGLRCPGSVFGVDLDSTVAYTRDLSDVSCLYKSPPNMVTLYLSRFPDLNFEDYFASSFNAVKQGSFKNVVEFKKDYTERCMVNAQFKSGLESLLQGDNLVELDLSGNSGAMAYKIGVFGGDTYASYVAVSPVDDKYMKIRYTTPTPVSDEAAMYQCESVYGLMRYLIASVGKPEGAKMEGSIQDFIDRNKK